MAAVVAAVDPPAENAVPVEVAPVTVAPRRPLDDPLIARGQGLVRARCVGCHSAMPTGVSLYALAPPFRWMQSLSPDDLRRVAADIQAGNHGAMPSMILTTAEAEAISAFVRAYANADRKTQKEMSVLPCFVRTC